LLGWAARLDIKLDQIQRRGELEPRDSVAGRMHKGVPTRRVQMNLLLGKGTGGLEAACQTIGESDVPDNYIDMTAFRPEHRRGAHDDGDSGRRHVKFDSTVRVHYVPSRGAEAWPVQTDLAGVER
jgi:hypothetical protein